MCNFIICEDDIEMQKSIQRIIKNCIRNSFDESLLYFYTDYSSSLKDRIHSAQPSIYIIDLQLNDGRFRGFEIARNIRQKDTKSPIIILTITDNMQGTAFKDRLNLLDYIVKSEPDAFERLAESIDIAISQLNHRNDCLTFNSNRTITKISFDDILYIFRNSSKRKVYIKTSDDIHTTNETLEELLSRLDQRFFQTHRACIVNTEYIKKIDLKKEEILLKNGELLTYLSRNRKQALADQLNLNGSS